MQARLIAYPTDAAALTRWRTPGERLRIGREAGCDLRLDHPSVSRAHAELHHDGRCWRLRDLGSKNGSFADGLAVGDDPLPAHCWLRFGDVHCEFAQFDDAQARAMREREQQRRDQSRALSQRIATQTRFDSLLDEVLQGVVDLAGCDRGFLLLADNGDFAVCASLSLDPTLLDQRRFNGSVGAVQRTLSKRAPVVINEMAQTGSLAARASVLDAGLSSLVCLPLFDGAQVFGAVYADRRGTGAPITQVDMELLGAFAESASLWLLARRALRRLDGLPRWATIVAAHAHQEIG